MERPADLDKKYPWRDPLILDLGAGSNKQEPRAIGIDNNPKESGADIILDLETELLPYPNDSVHKIYASNYLEHVQNLFHIMNEAWRVLIPGREFDIVVPHMWANTAIGDATHKRFFVPGSFEKDRFHVDKCPHPYPGMRCRFNLHSWKYRGIHHEYQNMTKEEFQDAIAHNINVADEIWCRLVKDPN